jgi:hypothetical protein
VLDESQTKAGLLAPAPIFMAVGDHSLNSGAAVALCVSVLYSATGSHSTTWCIVRPADSVGCKLQLQFTLYVMKAGRGIEAHLYFFFNLGHIWGGWSTPRPGRISARKQTRYPLQRRPGGAHGRYRRVRNIPPPRYDPRTVEPAAIPHPDESTRAQCNTSDHVHCNSLRVLRGGGGGGGD